MRAFIHILMAIMLLTLNSQPAMAMHSMDTMSEIEMNHHTQHDHDSHDCCDVPNEVDHDCPEGNCHCEMVCCITAIHYTPSLFKEIVLPIIHSHQNFSYFGFSIQNPLFPIWTPPDIA